MFTIGEVEIHRVSDGSLWSDRGGVFGLVPRPMWVDRYTPDEQDRLPMELTCLLVRAAGKTIVVDTGFGPRLAQKDRNARPHGGLLDGLARLGIAPGDVDLVINTHLHADHCSGNMTVEASGASVPTFPNAEYVVQRREYADAMQPNERTRATYFPANYQPLVERGQMRLLDGDCALVPGVSVVVTPGHTPGHQAVLFEGGGQYALFVADLATYAIHFERLAWMTAYDVEPLITLETKRRWQQWALETGALIIFQHDPLVPAGILRETEDGKRRFEVVQDSFA